jgi:hypothetical protein
LGWTIVSVARKDLDPGLNHAAEEGILAATTLRRKSLLLNTSA